MTQPGERHDPGPPDAPRWFDSHFHVFDPRFPLVANAGFLPDPFTVADYRRRVAALPAPPSGGAVVSGSMQGFDQSYLVAALAELGAGWVGVTQAPATISDERVRELDAAGVRAVRFNLYRGGGEGVDHLRDLGRRVHDLAGWHVELYVDSRDLADLEPVLAGLPAVSVDHLGLSGAGLPTLVRLAAAGVRVKATGFGRIDFPVVDALRRINAANPDALMFGTDLPSTRARRPFVDADFALIRETLGPEAAHRVWHANAAAFYRPAPGDSHNARTDRPQKP